MSPETVVFDRYQLHERIGIGGMGVVWKATDQLLCQTVALKHVCFATLDIERGRLTRGRALREARLAAQLRGHPHVVSVYDAIVDEDDIWLVMEYVPARSLSELLRMHGRLDPVKIAQVGADVADALAAGHTLGIEHRDVKPGNVLITAEGVVKLTDYGISHLAGDAQLTHTGISGTPAYLAPEVATHGVTSPASDVYSLGSTLYAAVEGRPPFGTDENVLRLLGTVRKGVIRPPHTAGPLGPVLLQLLRRDPSARPTAATARDLLADLAETEVRTQGRCGAVPQPWWRQRRTMAAAAVLSALMAAGAAGGGKLTSPVGEVTPPPVSSPTSPVTELPVPKPVAADPPAAPEPVAADTGTEESPTPDLIPRSTREPAPCALMDFEAFSPFNQTQIAKPSMSCPGVFGR